MKFLPVNFFKKSTSLPEQSSESQQTKAKFLFGLGLSVFITTLLLSLCAFYLLSKNKPLDINSGVPVEVKIEK